MTERGQALVEVLAALVLFALAGAVVAAAAGANLRSVEAAGRRGRLVAFAARELARLQLAPDPGTHTRTFTESGLGGELTRETTIDEHESLATLVVTATALPDGPSIRLTTRVQLPW